MLNNNFTSLKTGNADTRLGCGLKIKSLVLNLIQNNIEAIVKNLPVKILKLLV